MNRRYACSSPVSTTDTPYSMICGANATMKSVVVPSIAGRAQAAFGLAGMSRSAIGRGEQRRWPP